MAPAFRFKTPANQIDFPHDSSKQAALAAQWHTNLDGFTQQGIVGDPWNATNSSGITNYFNPVSIAIPAGSVVAPIAWRAFPGRIGFYFPQLSLTNQLSLADTEYQTNGQTFPQIPPMSQVCGGAAAPTIPFGPYGPRGWQDEYCEWCVTRDVNGKITRLDFTCENPEYWQTLWMIDPQRVLEIYRSTLDKPQIQFDDLCLHDPGGNVVIDASTGRPAYDPLNKWNSGTVSDASRGGAMHLTSTPNTIQTEIGLACAASIQRTIGSSDQTQLICCAQYGQAKRNSDPQIGQVTNQFVGSGKTVTLTNPPGLYIQTPDFAGNQYWTPDGTPAENFWEIRRGTAMLNGDVGHPLPGNFILHATFQVPSNKGYTVSDIAIGGSPAQGGQLIQWGGQVAKSFLMHIVATGVPAPVPAAVGCVGTPTPSLAQPQQLFHAAVFAAMSSQPVANPVGFAMTLVSNSTLIAPLIRQGAAGVPMVLTAASVLSGTGVPSPTVTFEGGDITAQVTGTGNITYAVPGNSYPSPATVLYLTVTVRADAATGLRKLYLTNSGQAQGAAAPAFLNVVPQGSII